jgi:hypothetical protein
VHYRLVSHRDSGCIYMVVCVWLTTHTCGVSSHRLPPVCVTTPCCRSACSGRIALECLVVASSTPLMVRTTAAGRASYWYYSCRQG